MQDELKRRAAEKALEYVADGMKLGLGTGSTVAHFIAGLGARVRDGLEVRCVATSLATERLADEHGIAVSDLSDLVTLDLTVDGTDEIDPWFRLIKGGGGALLREKIVAASSRQMVVIADASKKVETLGAFALPVEVVPFGSGSTIERMRQRLGEMGFDASLTVRRDAGGAVTRTDNANLIVDAALGPIEDPAALEQQLNCIPGVVETGLFLGLATTALIADGDGVDVLTPDQQ